MHKFYISKYYYARPSTDRHMAQLTFSCTYYTLYSNMHFHTKFTTCILSSNKPPIYIARQSWSITYPSWSFLHTLWSCLHKLRSCTDLLLHFLRMNRRHTIKNIITMKVEKACTLEVMVTTVVHDCDTPPAYKKSINESTQKQHYAAITFSYLCPL